MALHIRCTDCGREISIDDAFAGGMCRCPNCKGLIRVPGHAGQEAGNMVIEGSVPDRPDGPGDQQGTDGLPEVVMPPKRRHSWASGIVILAALTIAAMAAIALIHCIRNL